MRHHKLIKLSIEQEVVRAIEGVDLAEIRRCYRDQDEFVVLDRFLTRLVIDQLLLEVDSLAPRVNRNYVPGHKKGGIVSFYALLNQAPAILSLYRSPAWLTFLSRFVEAPLMLCPEDDPHSCALYYYTEPGDHIGFHFDTSYYKGTRFTVLLGLVERSSSRLVCQTHKDDPARMREIALATEPGTLVLFNGDKLWHKITPLGENEERVSLTLEYVTDPAMTPAKRFVSNMKDAIAYFGFRSVFKRRA